MLRGAEDQFLYVGDETYRMVSCLCVMMVNIRRVSSRRVFTCGGCDLRLAWRLVSRMSCCAGMLGLCVLHNVGKKKRHGCLSVVSVVCSKVEVSIGLITGADESYQVRGA